MRKILVAVDLQNDFIDGSLAVPGSGSVIPVINGAKHNYDLVYSTGILSATARSRSRAAPGPCTACITP